MRFIVAIMAAVLMLGQSLCYASSIDKDKGEHFAAGFAIDTAEAAIDALFTGPAQKRIKEEGTVMNFRHREIRKRLCLACA